jgi:paraquat-inducible protein B
MSASGDSEPAPLPRRTNSITRRSRWPGWIWAVPIAAIGIVVWLSLRAFAQRGIDVTVTFADAAGMKAHDTKVMYHGLEIGRVDGMELTPDRQRVVAHLDLDKDVESELTTGTRFYLQGAQVSLANPASLKAIIAGPTILMVPGRGVPSRQFIGYAGQPPERFSFTVPYAVSFAGDVGKLQPGAPVSLRGFTVGKVSSVALTTDPTAGTVETSVVLELDPTRFHIRNLSPSGVDWAGTFKTTLRSLVHHGLRATLTQSPPLLGAEQVDLVMAPDAAPAELASTGPYPEIPAESGGLSELPAKLGHLPVRQIGDNVRAITEQIKKLTASPQLQDSINHLDRSLAELDRTLHVAGPQVGPTLESVQQTIDRLRHTADDIDGTAAAARKLLGGSAASPNGNLQQAVHELTGTARAIRTLANYLDQHPEALIRGRSGDVYEESR